MAKAVLVMDMPESCFGCSCKYPSYKDDALYDCAITGKTIPIAGVHFGKPNWCPLRELPDEKCGAWTDGMIAAYNKYLSEVLERKE